MDCLVLSEMMLFLFAISLDNLFVGISYGMEKIKIPFSSILTMNFISVFLLCCSVGIGHLCSFIPSGVSKIVGFLCFFLLGCFKLFDFFMKHHLKSKGSKKLEFHFFRFLVSIYMDPKRADEDDSKILSIKESISLAFVLSLDSVVAGVGGGILYSNYAFLFLCAFCFGVLFLYFGKTIGSGLSKRVHLDLNWLSGVVFLLLAFLKI